MNVYINCKEMINHTISDMFKKDLVSVEELADKVLELDDELEEKNDKIYELEEEIESLKGTIFNLENGLKPYEGD